MNKLYVLLSLLLLSLAINIDNVKAQGWVKEIPTRNGIKINKIAPSNDSGFWAIGQINDTVNTLNCSGYPTPCRRNGVLLQKYSTSGIKVFEVILYSSNNLESLRATNVVDCKDNSGLIVYYEKETLVNGNWTQPISRYAKLNYNGIVIWSEKNINLREIIKEQNKISDFSINATNTGVLINDKLKFKLYSTRKSYDYNLNNLIETKDTSELLISFNNQLDSITSQNQSIYPIQNNLIQTENGDYYIIFPIVKINKLNNSENITYVLLKYNSNFHIVYSTQIDSELTRSDNFKLIQYNGYLYLNKCTIGNPNNGKIYKISLNGNIIATNPYLSLDYVIDARTIDNTIQWFSITNTWSLEKDFKVNIYKTASNSLLTNYNSVHFKKSKNSTPIGILLDNNIKLNDNSFVIFNLQYYDKDNFSYTNAFAKIDTLGNCSIANISGSIFGDRNSNCSLDATDVGLRNYSLKATSTRDTFYTTSDSLGKYELYIDTGFYNVSLLPNLTYPLWDANVCTPLKQVHLTENDTATTNFALFPRLSCPNLTAEINTAFLRRCFPNTYKVDYCNNGTINAANAYIDITFDAHLQYTSSSINAFSIGNNVYRFPVGNVNMGNCGTFNVTVYLDCDSTIIGQTHCVDAHIYPDTMCIESTYNGPIIEASAVCKDSIIEFKLKNKGANMPAAKHYIVIEDQIIRQSNNYQLAAGQEIIVRINTRNGATYRIEAEQDAAFPAAFGDAIAAAFVEGCTLNPGDTFRVGIINNYPLYDGEPYRDIDCHENRGSIDPNEKLAYPKGVDAQHYITKTTPIDYTILFQNTGTDTAFYVKVIDTISPYLDINSIRITNVSHPYTFTRVDSNIIEFEFNNIKLVDSTTNEPNSHGFVMFKINQKANNAIGTIIKNKADIIFDFNNTIITNTTFHTIGENYLRVDITTTNISKKYSDIELSVYPNPFRDKAIFSTKNVILKQAHLILFDLSGKIVKEFVAKDENQIIIDRNDLNNGLYIYKLFDGNEEIASGKISVQ